MNENFTFLIFTYHNVFHSLLSGWENGGFSHWCRRGAVGCWRDVHALLHVRVPNPAPLGYDQDQFSTQNWVKTTQRPYPAVSTQHLGWKNNPAFFRVYTLKTAGLKTTQFGLFW